LVEYSLAKKLNPYAWKPSQEIKKIKSTFLKAFQKKKVKELVKKALFLLKSKTPELAEYLFDLIWLKTAQNLQLQKVLEPYYNRAKQVKSMVYVESPQGKFYIDRCEVTVREYSRFLEWMDIQQNHGYCHPDERTRFPNKNHVPLQWEIQKKYPANPVVGVDWYDAYAYAHWKGKELPTSLQYLKAAPLEKLKDPDFSITSLNISGILYPIASFEEDYSSFGAYDLLSNAKEWMVDPQNQESAVYAGCYLLKEKKDFPLEIQLRAPYERDMHTGFRCVINIK
ncbi:MAG: hypothetical protein D6785_02135, partial [Planctomycetota bacterium]